MHKVQLTPIIGLPQFNGWSQVTTGAEGKLICAFSISGLNAGNVGRDAVAALSQANPQTADELHSVLLSLIKEVRDKGCNLELASCLMLGETALFAAIQGLILLKRQDKVGNVLRSDQQLKIIQGNLKQDDVFVLMTSHASAFMGEVKQKLIQGYDIDTIVTSVVPSLHSLEDSSLSSFGFVGLHQADAVTESVISDSPITNLHSGWDYSKDQEIAQEYGELSRSSNPVTEVVGETLPETQSSSFSEPADKSKLPLAEAKTPTSKVKTKGAVLAATAGVVLKKISLTLAVSTHALVKAIASRNQKAGGPANISAFSAHKRSKRMLILSLLLLVVVAMVAGLIFWWQRQRQAEVFAAESATTPWVEQIEQAKNVVESEPVSARASMEQAIQELEALAILYKEQPTSLKVINSRLEEAKQVYEEYSGREEMASLPTFYDFRLVESDFVVTEADVLGEQGLFLDTGKKQVISLDLSSKEVSKFPIVQKERIRDVVIGNEKVHILGNGVHAFALAQEEGDRELETLIEEGDSNRDGTIIGYFNSYIYVFNPSKRNIYRYAPNSDDEYSDPIGWIKPGNPVPYDEINSWSIDGDIWLGTKDGQVMKLTSGEVADFTISGLPQPFTKAITLFTQEDLQNLYVLEPSSQRVVILRKTGEFIREVKSPSLASATTLIVSETLGKALAMSGSLIFDIPLE